MAHPHWPLFDLRIRTPRLELRTPTDDDLSVLADLAARGVHDPASTPFESSWTDAPSPQMERSMHQFFWGERASLSVDRWRLGFAVVEPEQGIVGVQDALAARFRQLRQAETGSWLGQAYQGQGLGQEMRAAILHLLFAGLGAERALTAAWHDNPASLAVTERLGYLPNGEVMAERRGVADRQLRFVLPRQVWEGNRRDDIEIEGLEPCLEMLGLADDDGAT